MFKKLAADALGLSDVGVIIAPADYISAVNATIANIAKEE